MTFNDHKGVNQIRFTGVAGMIVWWWRFLWSDMWCDVLEWSRQYIREWIERIHCSTLDCELCRLPLLMPPWHTSWPVPMLETKTNNTYSYIGHIVWKGQDGVCCVYLLGADVFLGQNCCCPEYRWVQRVLLQLIWLQCENNCSTIHSDLPQSRLTALNRSIAYPVGTSRWSSFLPQS